MRESLPLKIEKNHFIAAGLFCKCYEHPDHRGECIKIPEADRKARKRLRGDLGYYRALHSRGVSMEYIADYKGGCITSLGDGYVYECVRDYDGGVSRTLRHYLEASDTDLEELYDALGELAGYLLSNRILISDIHYENILIQLDGEGGVKPVIVDGIGDRVLITVMNIFSKSVASKIVRRWNRFARRQLNGQVLLGEDGV